MQHISKTVYENYETAGKNNKTSFSEKRLGSPDKTRSSVNIDHPSPASRIATTGLDLHFQLQVPRRQQARQAPWPGNNWSNGILCDTHLETQFIHIPYGITCVYVCICSFSSLCVIICEQLWTSVFISIYPYISIYLNFKSLRVYLYDITHIYIYSYIYI